MLILDALHSGENETTTAMKVFQSTTSQQSSRKVMSSVMQFWLLWPGLVIQSESVASAARPQLVLLLPVHISHRWQKEIHFIFYFLCQWQKLTAVT